MDRGESLFKKEYFEVFGVDIIFDENLTPYIMEINSVPSVNIHTEAPKIPLNNLFDSVSKLLDKNLENYFDLFNYYKNITPQQ